jgi:hypothetical protein
MSQRERRKDMATATTRRRRMKIDGRILTALLVALAVLALTGGNVTRAQTKNYIVVQFYEDGTVGEVKDSKGNLLPKSNLATGKYTIVSFKWVDAAFVKYENSPATCSMWIGGVKYTWQC